MAEPPNRMMLAASRRMKWRRHQRDFGHTLEADDYLRSAKFLSAVVRKASAMSGTLVDMAVQPPPRLPAAADIGATDSLSRLPTPVLGVIVALGHLGSVSTLTACSRTLAAMRAKREVQVGVFGASLAAVVSRGGKDCLADSELSGVVPVLASPGERDLLASAIRFVLGARATLNSEMALVRRLLTQVNLASASVETIAKKLAATAATCHALLPQGEETRPRTFALDSIVSLGHIRSKFHPTLTLLDSCAAADLHQSRPSSLSSPPSSELCGEEDLELDLGAALAALAPDAHRADLLTALGVDGIRCEWRALVSEVKTALRRQDDKDAAVRPPKTSFSLVEDHRVALALLGLLHGDLDRLETQAGELVEALHHCLGGQLGLSTAISGPGRENQLAWVAKSKKTAQARRHQIGEALRGLAALSWTAARPSFVQEAIADAVVTAQFHDDAQGNHLATVVGETAQLKRHNLVFQNDEEAVNDDDDDDDQERRRLFTATRAETGAGGATLWARYKALYQPLSETHRDEVRTLFRRGAYVGDATFRAAIKAKQHHFVMDDFTNRRHVNGRHLAPVRVVSARQTA